MPFVLVLAWMLNTPAAEHETVGREAEIPAHDGWKLRGTLYAATDKRAGVILLHQCDNDRSSFGSLPSRLAAAGYAVLTFDYPGHGETAARPGGPESNLERERAQRQQDIAAAFDWFAAQPGVSEGPGRRWRELGCSPGRQAGEGAAINTRVCRARGSSGGPEPRTPARVDWPRRSRYRRKARWSRIRAADRRGRGPFARRAHRARRRRARSRPLRSVSRNRRPNRRLAPA